MVRDKDVTTPPAVQHGIHCNPSMTFFEDDIQFFSPKIILLFLGSTVSYLRIERSPFLQPEGLHVAQLTVQVVPGLPWCGVPLSIDEVLETKQNPALSSSKKLMQCPNIFKM
jgi:hypothetical protein